MLPKLAIITTHPIQYNAPVFRMLSERGKIDIKVFYTWEQANVKVYDVDFGKEITWDIPLLEGYAFSFVKNVAVDPGLHHFNGINNPTLIEEVKSYNPSAVLVYGWNFKSHLKAIRFFKNKIPVIFRGDSTLLDEKRGLKSTLRKFFLSWVYKHIDVALYVGKNNKYYFKKFGVNSNQLVFTPHAIDIERFHEASLNTLKSTAITRRSLNIRNEARIFLFAGKLEYKKNPFLLVNAFKQLDSQLNHLVFVGNGILEEQLKESSYKHKNIHFVDFQNQMTMPSIYSFADVFVLPSAGPGETWGLAVNEAMACNRPVLVSDKCGCAIDLIEEGFNGYTFASGNEEALVEKLILLSKKTNKELAHMGRNSYTKIQSWSFEHICNSIENTLLQHA